MEEIFGIENYNIIQDKENYYFFRALNMADNKDLEDGIITNKEGKIIKIRTDRERYIENPENGKTKYNQDDEISLQQAYDHIKIHYRKDTNCISLTSDTNVAINYGRVYYKDKYIMVKVPKKEYGSKVKDACKYMLEEIEKRLNTYISSLETNNKMIQELEKIENLESTEEIKKLVKANYYGKINISKSGMKKGIEYKIPTLRFRNYPMLSDKQNLFKNKLIAKITLLERKDKFKRLVPYASNNRLINTVGRAITSMELLHYGKINESEIQEISSEMIDRISVAQNKGNVDFNTIF